MRGKYRPCFKESQPGDEVSHSRQPVGRVGAKGPLKQELAKEQSLPSMSQAEVNSWTLGAAAAIEAAVGTRLTLIYVVRSSPRFSHLQRW